jgi:hypothetical protein
MEAYPLGQLVGASLSNMPPSDGPANRGGTASKPVQGTSHNATVRVKPNKRLWRVPELTGRPTRDSAPSRRSLGTRQIRGILYAKAGCRSCPFGEKR